MHPDWDYKFSNTEGRRYDLLSTLNLSDYAIKAYDKIQPITQSDIWRFAMVGKNGGMWADLDSRPKAPVEELLKNNPGIECDLITSPRDDAGRINCANFIIAKDSFLGNELANIIYEHLEMSGHSLKNKKIILHFDTLGSIWKDFVDIHKDKIKDIYSEEYAIHSDMLKPPSDWLAKYESLAHWTSMDRLRINSPGIYTDEWKRRFEEVKETLDTLCYNKEMSEETTTTAAGDKCCAACTCENPHRSAPVED